MAVHHPQSRGANLAWRFHVPVFLGIAGGVCIVFLVELRAVPQELRDGSLIVSGALMGLVTLWFDEVLRTGPERKRAVQLRNEDRLQHESERSEDHHLIARLEEDNARLSHQVLGMAMASARDRAERFVPGATSCQVV